MSLADYSEWLRKDIIVPSGGWLADVVPAVSNASGIWDILVLSALFVMSWVVLRVSDPTAAMILAMVYDITIPLQHQMNPKVEDMHRQHLSGYWSIQALAGAAEVVCFVMVDSDLFTFIVCSKTTIMTALWLGRRKGGSFVTAPAGSAGAPTSSSSKQKRKKDESSGNTPAADAETPEQRWDRVLKAAGYDDAEGREAMVEYLKSMKDPEKQKGQLSKWRKEKDKDKRKSTMKKMKDWWNKRKTKEPAGSGPASQKPQERNSGGSDSDDSGATASSAEEAPTRVRRKANPEASPEELSPRAGPAHEPDPSYANPGLGPAIDQSVQAQADEDWARGNGRYIKQPNPLVEPPFVLEQPPRGAHARPVEIGPPPGYGLPTVPRMGLSNSHGSSGGMRNWLKGKLDKNKVNATGHISKLMRFAPEPYAPHKMHRAPPQPDLNDVATWRSGIADAINKPETAAWEKVGKHESLDLLVIALKYARVHPEVIGLMVLDLMNEVDPSRAKRLMGDWVAAQADEDWDSVLEPYQQAYVKREGWLPQNAWWMDVDMTQYGEKQGGVLDEINWTLRMNAVRPGVRSAMIKHLMSVRDRESFEALRERILQDGGGAMRRGWVPDGDHSKARRAIIEEYATKTDFEGVYSPSETEIDALGGRLRGEGLALPQISRELRNFRAAR